jgi:hypothetical protein
VWLSVALLAFALSLVGGEARACCDVIPSPDDFSRAFLGSVTKPALVPGFPVQVFVRPPICEQHTRSAAPDFRDPSSGCTNEAGDLCPVLAADQFSVNLFFTPRVPGAAHHVVVLRDDCSSLDAGGCGALPGGGKVFCIDDPGQYQIIEVDLPGGEVERRLSFNHPQTAGLTDILGTTTLGSEDLAGPLRVAVTRSSEPLACGLATESCAESTEPLVTCADALYVKDTSCGVGEAFVDPVGVAVTALPRPNKFTELCPNTDPEGLCQHAGGLPPEVRAAQDSRGNLLVPMDYRDVIGGQAFARTLRGGLGLLQGTVVTPVLIKNDDHVESRAFNWAPVLPIFEPVSDPTRAGEFFGTIDAGFVIHRLFNSSCADDPATPEPEDEIPCSVDAECTTSCSLSAFPPILAAVQGGTGPIVGACPLDPDTSEPRCQLGEVVAVETVAAASNDERAVPSPVNECVGQVVTPQELVSRNDDADLQDLVFTLRDRGFGFDIQQIGSGGKDGRALTSILEPPRFRFLAYDSENEVAAFLEPEAGEGDCSLMSCDRNASNLAFDHLLRSYQLGPPGAEQAVSLLQPLNRELPPTTVPSNEGTVGLLDLGVAVPGKDLMLAVEPTRNVANNALAVSDGVIVFRASRLANAPRSLQLVSEDSTYGDPVDAFDLAVSPDGRYVAFTSYSPDLVPGDTGFDADVFLRDLVSGTTTRISLPGCGLVGEPNGSSGGASVSEGGEWVAFWSVADNLVVGDDNPSTDVFVRRTAGCEVVRVSLDSSGGVSLDPSISADGRFVAFESDSTEIDDTDSDGLFDAYLHDRDADENGTTTMATARTSLPAGERVCASW